MADFAKLAATAQRLIEKNGRTVTFVRASRTPANPAKPWRGPDNTTPETFEAIACFVPPAGSGFGRREQRDDTLQKNGTQLCLLAASSIPDGIDIKQVGQIRDDSKTWKVDYIDPLQPGDLPLVYVLAVSA